MKTRSVLGYKLRLEVGKHYIAIPSTLGDYTSMAKLTITIAEAGNPFGSPVAKVDTMPYDKANQGSLGLRPFVPRSRFSQYTP